MVAAEGRAVYLVYFVVPWAVSPQIAVRDRLRSYVQRLSSASLGVLVRYWRMYCVRIVAVADRLLMYERRIESSLFKTMAELAKLRLMRELDPPTEKPTPNPASAGGEHLPRQTKRAPR